MNDAQDWRTVYDFWFPPGLESLNIETARGQIEWWFGGGANPELPPFAPTVEAARAGRLDHWTATPKGRLSLIILLDQFPRGLFAGTPQAFASDPHALRLALEGLESGQYYALTKGWEKTFFYMPLAHAEGPDHLGRLARLVQLTEALAAEAPADQKAFYLHSINQCRGNIEVISRFGRFPHRNSALGRTSTPEEQAYIETGDFVHLRRPPEMKEGPS